MKMYLFEFEWKWAILEIKGRDGWLGLNATFLEKALIENLPTGLFGKELKWKGITLGKNWPNIGIGIQGYVIIIILQSGYGNSGLRKRINGNFTARKKMDGEEL